jgi:hypothetical protein
MSTSNSGKTSWRLLIVLVVIFLLALYGIFIFASHPRAVEIVMTSATQTATQVKNAISGGGENSSTTTNLRPLDKAAYDAKMLALANYPPLKTKTIVMVSSSTGATSTKIVTIPPASPRLWPVKTAPYPNAGALLPFNRIVAYYGNLYSTQMGVLGEYPKPQMLAMLASTTAEWAAADPSTPVIPALDYIVVTAQGSAGADGKYRARMPDSQTDQIVQMAQQINGIVILDVQIGLSNVQTEVPLLEKYLKMPNVELAIDPEFAMHSGAKPGTVIGTLDATDINFAAQYLANLVRQNNLPPKVLIIHRFTQEMVTNYKAITPLPEVQIVMDMDGFGSAAKKINTYQSFIVSQPVQFTGFKLFYKNDQIPSIAGSDHMMTPTEVLKLSPQPSFIQYQ